MANISLQHIKKIYPGNVEVINDLNLEIYDKEFIILVGPSGCGKSTTLRMIAGLEEISGGELRIGDKIVNDVEPKDRDIAMVFQNYALYPHMTVYKNLAFGLKLRKMDKAEIDRRVHETAKILDIEHLLNRKPKALSGGQRQRVALGRTIVREPKVFLLDEPLSNLDAKLRASMRTEISKLHARLATTFIYVTHDQSEAMALSDRIIIMRSGVVEQIGSPQEIYYHPVNEFVANFIGETNIIDGVMQGDDLVTFEDKKFPCRARGFNKNEKVDVVIRPEHLDIVPRSEGMLKGVVKSQLFKGMHYDTVVETRVGTTITVKMQVSQDRPVYNEEKGEKISANAFLLDVEDVEELDDAKVVALASAEAWDAETEEPISIKNVEYDIKPEVGSYSVTFTTAAGTSITVKAAVMAENRVESKVYQEEIYAMNFFKKVEDIQESIALDTDLETWASASAWSLEDGEQVEITDVKYDFDPETIEPGVYDVTFSTEGYEYKVSTTRACEEGAEVGLIFRPEDIHVMKKEGQW